MLEIAELGKPPQIHDKDEVGGFTPPAPTREIKMGDVAKSPDDAGSAPPSLRMPGEPDPAPNKTGSGRVQLPKQPADPNASTPATQP